MGFYMFLLARFEVPQFLEVNVKSIEIADMLFNYIIFRFKLQYMHYLAIGNATSCMSMFCIFVLA